MNKFANILKDVITTKAFAARTFESDPLQSFRFTVSIGALPAGMGFQKVAGLSREIAVVEYLENMYSHTHKLPGRETVGEITLERGMYASTELQDAYESVINGGSRFDMTINVNDRHGVTRRTFQLAECWFSKYEVGDLDATSDDVIIETITVQCEKFL